MSSELWLNTINTQNNLRSKPIRENFTDIQNEFNLLRAEVYASLASTASEVTTARGGFSALVDNINIRKVGRTGVIGGSVTATSHNYVVIATGSAICPDGSGVKWSRSKMANVSTVTKPRYGVAVVNNDSSLAIEWGATAINPVLPNIAQSQRPLASIYQGTANPPLFSSSVIWDAREQGCYNATTWRFKIQESLNLYGNTGSNIEVGSGRYIEDITYKSNTIIDWSKRSSLYNTLGVLQNKRNDLIQTNGFIHESTVTNSSIYATLVKYMPSVNDSIVVNGCRVVASAPGNVADIYTYSRAKRTASTTITLYGAYLQAGDSSEAKGLFANTVTATDSNSTNDISIAW